MKLSRILIEADEVTSRVEQSNEKASKRVKVVADEIFKTFPELNYERLKYAVASAFLDLTMSNDLSEGLVDNISKIDITYIAGSGRYYTTYLFRGDQRDKLDIEEANDLLDYLGVEGVKIPRRYDSTILDNIVEQLQALEIEASYDDSMDVS